MSRPGTPRRTFLAGSALWLAGGALASTIKGCARAGTPLSDSATARRIGARFADRYPTDVEALFAGRPPEREADWAPRLEALRRADFDADRLVRVEGWWLAETEVRLCVLLHTRG